MPLRLRILPSARPAGEDGRGPTAERTIEIADDVSEIRIGRRPDLEMPLPFTVLSGVHARLARGQGSSERAWTVEDLGSRNGTYVGEQRLSPGEKRPLNPGMQFSLAHVDIVFEGAALPASGGEGTATIARRLVADLFSAGAPASAPTVVVVSGAPNKGVLRLEERDRRYVIGRVESCDLRLAVEEISREHAVLTRKWNGVFLNDLGSKNGVRLNGSVVGEQRVRDGDLIQIGPVALRLFDPEDRYLREFEGRAEAAASRAPRSATLGIPTLEAPATKPFRMPADLHPAVAGALAAEEGAPTEPDRSGPRALPGGSRLATWIAVLVLAAIVTLAIITFG